jgi:hypothetical protein
MLAFRRKSQSMDRSSHAIEAMRIAELKAGDISRRPSYRRQR